MRCCLRLISLLRTGKSSEANMVIRYLQSKTMMVKTMSNYPNSKMLSHLLKLKLMIKLLLHL